MKTTKKMTKAELADLAARAMNLLMHVRCATDDNAFANREENEFNALAAMLPEGERECFWNNGTLRARDLA
jgi:hypothetical protein